MRFASIYKQFMLSPASHLPVLGEEKLLIGFLSKEKLQIEMADLSRSSMELDEIPSEFLDKDISESLLAFFSTYSKIPVLDLQGNRIDSWDKPRLLAEYTKLAGSESILKEDKDNKERSLSAQPSETSKNPVHWFTQLILESFSDPLFATDLEGTAVFHNDRFESEILSQSFFRNSVSFAERYLRDLNKDLFAAFLKANDLDMNANQENGKVLQTILPKIGYMVRVVSLLQSDKLVGYLYHFIHLKRSILDSNSEGFQFPSIEEAFANKLPLELVLKETESFYIYQSLLRNKRNVSHAAEELGIPRSTLQNRIRFLDIENRFQNPKLDKVPRKRTSTDKKTAIVSDSDLLKPTSIKNQPIIDKIVQVKSKSKLKDSKKSSIPSKKKPLGKRNSTSTTQAKSFKKKNPSKKSKKSK
jgi:hypothetical protein